MNEHGGGQFGPFKAALAEVAVEALRPVTESLQSRFGRSCRRSLAPCHGIDEPLSFGSR